MGVSEKALKLRIKSVRSTEHITRAMQLVASSKLRRATERMEQSRAYFIAMHNVFSDLASCAGPDAPKEFFEKRDKGKVCLIAIAGDRGLAGGYNNNVFNMARGLAPRENTAVLPIGKKAHEYFSKKKYELLGDVTPIEGLTMDVCAEIGRKAAEGYKKGEFSSVYLIYTSFTNMLSQNTASFQLLPLAPQVEKKKSSGYVLYEPSPAAVFKALIPEYISGIVYCGICESFASEQASRRNAMDNATKNADEMIEKLGLQYNRARQGAITQEITEIVAGSEQS